MIDIRWLFLLLAICFVRELVLKKHNTYKQGHKDAIDAVVKSWNRGINTMEDDYKFRLISLKSDLNQLIEKHKSL